jgi:Fe-S cluster biogenesis protein NfuA|tara:strand:+ start:126 stop:506 length:381 start_codon:yes stop_codon:yes gene_type:complete
MTDKQTYDATVENIKQILETYVQPAVAGHGGVVNYLDYNDGVVTLEMSGACSGCAMSSMTLKQGIENTLTNMIPEVTTVVGVDDLNSGVDPYMTEDPFNDPFSDPFGMHRINLEDYDIDLPKEPED